jgi:hypothetical protein
MLSPVSFTTLTGRAGTYDMSTRSKLFGAKSVAKQTLHTYFFTSQLFLLLSPVFSLVLRVEGTYL